MSDEETPSKPTVTRTQAKRFAELAAAQAELGASKTEVAHLRTHIEELKARPSTGSLGALTPHTLRKWFLVLGIPIGALFSGLIFMYSSNISSHERTIELLIEDKNERIEDIKELCGLE